MLKNISFIQKSFQKVKIEFLVFYDIVRHEPKTAKMTLYIFKRFLIKMIRKAGLMLFVKPVVNFYLILKGKYAGLLGENPLEYIYNDKFFDLENHKYTLGKSPEIFAKLVKKIYNPKSVVDIGCGCGLYLAELEKLGIKDILGIDGSPAAERNLAIDKNKFLLMDVTKEWHCEKKYDAAICFEVIEHIPTNKSEILIKNITQNSDLVFFTSALKGWGGHHHINEQNPEFWIGLFKKFNFSLLERETKEMKNLLNIPEIIFWLKDTIMIFKKDTKSPDAKSGQT